MHPAAEAALTSAGIVLPSLLLTWIVRRWFAPVPWPAAGVFLLLTFGFIGRGIFTADLPLPVDEAARGYPYTGVVGEIHSRNPLTNDTTRLFLPWMAVVREELSRGRLPLWNRYSFSGYPLLANGESAPFYPGFLATLFVPLPKQIVAMAGLKIFVALLFAFLLLRREGLSGGAAAFGAAAFAFCSFQTVYLYYSTTAVSSLLPAAAYALVNAVDRPDRGSSLWLVAAVVATLQAAGHPESVLHVAAGACGFLLIDLFRPPLSAEARTRRQKLQGIVVIAGGTVGGLMLAAPAWIPVLEQVFRSARFAEVAGSGARAMTTEFPPAAAYALLNPDLFGNPAQGTWSWILNYSVVASSYFGLLPLALFPAALLAARADLRDRLLAMFGIVTFLVSMNWTLPAQLINAVPPFSIVANDKLRFVTCLIVVICASRVVEELKTRISSVALISSAIVFALAARAVGSKLGVTVGPPAAAAVLGVVAFWALVIIARRLRKPSLIPAAAASMIVVELFLLNAPFNALVQRRYYKPDLPIVEALRGIPAEEPFRIVGHDWVLMPNASALYGLEDVRGSDPMALASYMEYFSLIGVGEPGMDVQRVVDLDHPALDFLNVRYALAEPGHRPSPTWAVIYRGEDGALLQNLEWIPRFLVPARVVERDPDRSIAEQLDGTSSDVVVTESESLDQADIRAELRTEQKSPLAFSVAVDAEAPVLIASSQPAAPGWRVRVGGRSAPIVRVNGAFIGFTVPQGRHSVEVFYRPASFYVSALAAFAALLLLGVASRRLGRERVTSGSAR